jgi:hypothetical protein
MVRNCNVIRIWKKICTFWQATAKKSSVNIDECDIQQVVNGYEIQTAVLESATSSYYPQATRCFETFEVYLMNQIRTYH